MNYLQNILNESLVQAIGWTILHSIWQGALIVVIAALVLSFFKNPSSKLKYNIYTSTLFAILASSLATFAYLHHTAETPKIEWSVPVEVQNDKNDIVELVFLDNINSTASETQEAETSVSAFFSQASSLADEYMGLIVVLWILGCLFFSIRFIGGFLYIQQLKKHSIYPVETYWKQKLELIQKRVGIQKSVRLLESAKVKAPMVIGHFKPIILFPIGALSGLNPSQVEAILAHELAHIHRNDYLVNILQSLAEIVLFYHPAAWWLSHKMEAAREHCCDDLAINLCGDRLVYAKALTEIESIRLQEQTPYLAAAFAGKGGEANLMERIQRLFSPSENKFSFLDGWVASFMLLIALLTFSWTSHSSLEAAEKEVSILIESVVEDLGDAFFDMTADSSKRAEKKLKKVEKERLKLEEKQTKKTQQRLKRKVYVLKGKDGKYVNAPLPPNSPLPPSPPLPPMDIIADLPNANIFVLPEVPQLPIDLFEGLRDLPVLPTPPVAPDLNGLFPEGSDMTVWLSQQPDSWEFITEGSSNILFFDENERSYVLKDKKGNKSTIIKIEKDKDKNKWKYKLKNKMKGKENRLRVIELNLQLDSIKQREFRQKLQPLKDSLNLQQNKLKELLKDMENLDEAQIDDAFRDYEQALDRYEDQLEDWQNDLEQEYEYHYEWNEKDREAFEGKMEKWGEEWGEKFSQQWNEQNWEEWAGKWEAWGEQFGKQWNEEHWEEWAEKWEDWGEQFGKQWNEEHWEEWAEKMEDWGEEWSEKWEKEWEANRDEYEQNMDKWQEKWEQQMDEHEQELNLFEDSYEEALERKMQAEDDKWENDLRSLSTELRQMLEEDKLIGANTDEVKFKYDGKGAKVNGRTIRESLVNKYADLATKHLGNRARFILTFSKSDDNISLKGRNMEVNID